MTIIMMMTLFVGSGLNKLPRLCLSLNLSLCEFVSITQPSLFLNFSVVVKLEGYFRERERERKREREREREFQINIILYIEGERERERERTLND